MDPCRLQPSAGHLSCEGTGTEPPVPQLWGCVLLEVQGGNVQISRGLFPSPTFSWANPSFLGHWLSVPVSGLLLVRPLPELRLGSQDSEKADPGPLFCFCSQGYSTSSPDVQCLENHYFTRFDCLALSGRRVNPDGPSGPVSVRTKVPSITSDVWVRSVVT